MAPHPKTWHSSHEQKQVFLAIAEQTQVPKGSGRKTQYLTRTSTQETTPSNTVSANVQLQEIFANEFSTLPADKLEMKVPVKEHDK